jgi:RNA polymerase sigma-70 factor (ECF subfamily)
MVCTDHDQLAFKEIYLRYAEHLFNLAYSKTNDRAAAEDVVQITFVKLWSSREKLKINHSLKAYLYTSTKNNIITYYYRSLSRKTVSIEAVQEWVLPVDDETQQQLCRSQTHELYQKTLQELPEKCREVFILSREGYSLKEIAKFQNISPKTAEVHIGKALKYLRKKLRGSALCLLFLFFN